MKAEMALHSIVRILPKHDFTDRENDRNISDNTSTEI
jgi:hypothetical protein